MIIKGVPIFRIFTVFIRIDLALMDISFASVNQFSVLRTGKSKFNMYVTVKRVIYRKNFKYWDMYV